VGLGSPCHPSLLPLLACSLCPLCSLCSFCVWAGSVAAEHFKDQVDYWVTFNEPQIFVLCTHCWCNWPSAPRRCPTGTTAYFCATPWGLSGLLCAMWAPHTTRPTTKSSKGEQRGYICILRVLPRAVPALGSPVRLGSPGRWTHLDARVPVVLRVGPGRSSAPIGVAHSVAILTPFSALDMFASFVQDYYFLFTWIDNIVHKLDFCGLNYYGQVGLLPPRRCATPALPSCLCLPCSPWGCCGGAG